MKIYKRIAGMLPAVMVLVLFLMAHASAAGSIGLNRECSLTLSCQDDGTPLTGVDFSVYLAATVDENGGLTPVEAFSGFHVNIRGKNDAAWKTLATTLEAYVLRDGLTPTASGSTDEHGRLSFPDGGQKLASGLYLVLGSRHRQNGLVYDVQPSMVLIPVLDSQTNDWNYGVTVIPKYESRPEGDTVTRKVLKVWRDKDHEKERPGKITVQLLRDGKIYDTVILSADNNWRYTWDDLDDKYQWTVAEKEPEGYTVEITRQGITFVVTNTWDKPDDPASPGTPSGPGNPKLPQTGQLWWPVPLLVCTGILLIVAGLIRRRGALYEE